MFGCGTLHVQTAAEDGTVVLDDVPDVEQVHREMTELLFGSHAGWPPGCIGSARMTGEHERRDRPTGSHVAELIMDRPEALNALSTEQARRSIDACAELADDPQLECGDHHQRRRTEAFCVGADLKERAGFDDDDLRAQRPVFVDAFGAVCSTWPCRRSPPSTATRWAAAASWPCAAT